MSNTIRAENLKAKDCYLSEDIYASLEDLATNGKLTFEKIPSVKTIKGWIGRYSTNFKKEVSEKALLKNSNNYNIMFGRTSNKRQEYR
ncbi:25166_t:CDS:2 [Dentiscutata erythropus]|uniref:25166_t:CDS:1 n=1 Tax=Dentiscutata erythropus TaxID=1348616 RepID=A0A9N9NRH4_9GLOM|nr:25166_t:CDS:2 [Dentiscutata erythropus]